MDATEHSLFCRHCKAPFAKPAKRNFPSCFCSKRCWKLCKDYSIGRNEHCCLQCNILFYLYPVEVRTGEGKFCSKTCAHLYQTKQYICLNCQNVFTRKLHRTNVAEPRYCSMQCRTVYLRMRERTCTQCGVLFIPIRFQKNAEGIQITAESNRRTCSAMCSRKARAKFFKVKHGKDHPSWQGGRSQLLVGYRGPGWKKRADNVRKRAKYCCEHCGKSQEENGRTLDVNHIIPWFNFTDHRKANTYSNLEALCRSCHLRAEPRTNDQLVFTFMNGKRRKIAGYISKQARFTREEVLYIREAYDAGATCLELAEQFRCHRSTVSQIVFCKSYLYVVSRPRPTGKRKMKRRRTPDMTGVRHIMPGLYTGTRNPKRDEMIAHRVLSGESYSAVAIDWSMSKQSVYSIVFRWCARQAPEIFKQLGKMNHSAIDDSRPSLTTLRAHRVAFGITDEELAG